MPCTTVALALRAEEKGEEQSINGELFQSTKLCFCEHYNS